MPPAPAPPAGDVAMPSPVSRTSSVSVRSVAGGRDRDVGGLHARGRAVAHRVLDERLQRERGHARVEQRGIDRGVHAKPIAESYALELEVLAHERPFIAKRNEIAVLLERRAQQRRHLLGRVGRAARIDGNQLHHRVQRIEEEVRVQLRAERPELHANAGSLRARGALRSLDRVRDPRDHHVEPDAEHEEGNDSGADDDHEAAHESRSRRRSRRGSTQRRTSGAADEMDEREAQPEGSRPRHALGEAIDENAEQRGREAASARRAWPRARRSRAGAA